MYDRQTSQFQPCLQSPYRSPFTAESPAQSLYPDCVIALLQSTNKIQDIFLTLHNLSLRAVLKALLALSKLETPVSTILKCACAHVCSNTSDIYTYTFFLRYIAASRLLSRLASPDNTGIHNRLVLSFDCHAFRQSRFWSVTAQHGSADE